MRQLGRTMAYRSSSSAPSSSTSRSGYFIRNRLLAAGNKAAALVGNALAAGTSSSSEDIYGNDDGSDSKPNPYTEERCLVFVRALSSSSVGERLMV